MRPLRAELWRDGVLVASTGFIGQTFTDDLEAQAGDQVVVYVEHPLSALFIPCNAKLTGLGPRTPRKPLVP